MAIVNFVTVGVISYNSSSTILETLNSIINQSYKDIKIIISDDASTDNTPTVIQQWVKENQEHNVQVITHDKNLGVSGNLNGIINIASTKWIKIIAADDILEENCIDTFVKYARKNNASIITSACRTFGDSNKILPKPSKEKFFHLTAQEQFYKLGIANFVISPTLFFDVEFLKKIGGYDENFKIIEDLPLLLKCTSMGERIHFIKEVTVKYRIHNKSSSLSKDRYNSYINDLDNIWRIYFSKFSWLYKLHYFILKKAHPIRNPNIKILVKFLSPLYIKHKLNECCK